MNDNTRTPTLATVLAAHRASVLEGVRVAMPARVTRYDSTLQVVDVQPLLGESHEDQAGDRQVEALPPLIEVPVMFPGGGGYRVLFPIREGDTVLVIFSDRSLDEWKVTGSCAPPADDRRHALSDAIAIPGLHSRLEPLAPADAAAGLMLLGLAGAPQDFVALGARVESRLSAIEEILRIPIPGDVGAAFSAAAAAVLGTAITPIPQQAVLSSTVKVSE